ncbi:MAG TPA: hypothetical protein VGQ90_09830 [Stellaceae bacterium]|nr:hypothetical protein [Stellaceae bacterium]
MTRLMGIGSVKLGLALAIGVPVLLGACTPVPPPCDACAIANQAQATANQALSTAQQALAAANASRSASSQMYQRSLRK